MSLIERQIHAAPKAPGCYRFLDKRGKVLYIGKANDLSKRVRAYLRPAADGRHQIPYMMQRAESVEFIVVNNEKEALILENNLIKRFKPRYNIVLASDDRTYVSVRMDMRHPFPRATVVHKYKRDGARYFGPYASADKLRRSLETLRRTYPLRLCSDHVLRNRSRPCIYHEIGTCCAPCVDDKVTQDEYSTMVREFVDVLEGKNHALLDQLESEMAEASKALDFERAAKIRDRWQALKTTVVRQRTQIGDPKLLDRDVLGWHRAGGRACISVLMYREGKLENTSTREYESDLPDDEVLSAFAKQFYARALFIPSEVLVPMDLEGQDVLADWLSDRSEHRVKVLTPKRGEKTKLVDLANVNARHALEVRNESEERHRQLLVDLQDALDLDKTPHRMECYDISHQSGKETVASGVCFIDGRADKSKYRKYKIKSHDRNDDFASMEEVLRRRLKRAILDDEYPDLIVIDGGIPQINRVQSVFEELNIVGIDLIALAKSRDKKTTGVKTDERVFLPYRNEPITLPQRSSALHLLMRIRDEAHRFAIEYHRRLKRKQAVKSGLDSIAGVGPKRKRALIRQFGSPRGIKLATVDELAEVDGISPTLAQTIFDHFADARAKLLQDKA